ncbi:MAG: transporter [Faecalibacterium sp.]
MDSTPQQNTPVQQHAAHLHAPVLWDEHRNLQLRKFTIHGAELLELLVAGLVLIGLLLSIFPLIRWMPGLLMDGNDVEIRTFLERALDIVIGVEFIKMLVKHNPSSSLQVLLCAIARHMVVGHNSAMENLLSVAAIALIFIIRKYFFVPSFGTHLHAPHPTPESGSEPSLLSRLFHMTSETTKAPSPEPATASVAEDKEEEEEPEDEDEEEDPEENDEDCEVGELKIHC